MNRAMPITKQEFQSAVTILLATAPTEMQRFLTSDRDLAGVAERADAKLHNAVEATKKLNRRHEFAPSDIHPDTCSKCGKYRSYSAHV